MKQTRLTWIETGTAVLVLVICLAVVGSSVSVGAAQVAPPRVTGFLFADANGDGVRQATEWGLAGVTIKLGAVSTVSALPSGWYALDVAPGTYVMQFSVPATFPGWQVSDRTLVVGATKLTVNVPGVQVPILGTVTPTVPILGTSTLRLTPEAGNCGVLCVDGVPPCWRVCLEAAPRFKRVERPPVSTPTP